MNKYQRNAVIEAVERFEEPLLKDKESYEGRFKDLVTNIVLVMQQNFETGSEFTPYSDRSRSKLCMYCNKTQEAHLDFGDGVYCYVQELK